MFDMALPEHAFWGGKGLPGQDELPSDDGEPMETEFHDAQAALLKDSLIDAWQARPDFFVAGNMFVYFSERQIRANDFRGPDVFVVLDVERKVRKSWVAWEEDGKLPDVVVEVTSPSTEHVDRGDKMRIYAQIWRTPAYFIFDPESEKLDGFALDTARRAYVPLAVDANGDFVVGPLGLHIGLRPTRYREHDRRFVRWIDAEGKALPTAQERAEREREPAEHERERAEHERERAEHERERAERERERADALEGELRALREQRDKAQGHRRQ
jgi:Uma2 family endonuclease